MGFWNLPNTFATLSGNQPASKLDDNFDALAIVPQYATAASGTNAIALTVPIPFTSYAIGMQFYCVAPGTNTSSTVTLNVNSVGAVNVVKDNNNSLDEGDIVSGSVVSFYYDGSNFHLMVHRSSVVCAGNRIINGDFVIDSRNGGSQMAFSTTNTYGPDRWFVGASTATNLAGCTEQVGSLNPGGVPNGPGIGWSACRVLRNSGTYAGFLWLAQAIESANCIDMAGQTVTLSFKARRGSAFAGTLSAAIRSGTGLNEGRNGLSGGTWTNYIQEAANTWSLTTAWQRFSVTATLQSGMRELGVYFATSAYTGTGSANDYFDITDVQLEVGAAPTDFQRIPYQNTLEACQGYYQAGVFSSAGARYANGFGSWHLRDIEYTIPIRAANNPTLTGFAGSNCSTPALGSVTVRGFSIQVQTSAAAQYSATGNWAVDAEI